MSFLFGKKKTPQEIMRENKRLIDRSIRELDRERSNMQRQEQRLIGEIKKMARSNQTAAMRIMAKDLVRTRAAITKFFRMKAQMQQVSLKLQTMQSTQAMAQAMYGITGALAGMNKAVNLPAVTKIMQEFEKQNEMMDMKDEMMNDAMDDVLADEDEEEETEAIVQQVLDEIGLDTGKRLGEVSASKAAAATEKPDEEAEDDKALQARLANLRKT
jgi:charged multivesicular body protein 2A